MDKIIQSVRAKVASREMDAVADELALACANADLHAQRKLIDEWDRLVSLGGTCQDRQIEIDEVKQNLAEEDKEEEREVERKDMISRLERMLLEEQCSTHEIKILYYRLLEHPSGDIPHNLDQLVKTVLDEDKALRRRKTRTIVIVTAAVFVIAVSYLGFNFFQQNREAKILAFVAEGNRCLENYDHDCFDTWQNTVQVACFQRVPRIEEVLAKHDEYKEL